MIPATASRVEQSTDAQINDRIRRETERNVHILQKKTMTRSRADWKH